MHLGFIGFGEAAFELASGLKQQGLEKMTAYDPLWNVPAYEALILHRATTAGVTLVQTPEEVLREINAVIVAVPADKALEVSEQLKPNLKSGMVYIDVSASSPDVKKKVAANIQEKGGKFVDAAMMGPLPVYKHEVPILASGEGTDTFMENMQPFGMNISKVSEVPGEATAVKLIRSIYMKGIAGLYVELLEAAHEFNVETLVIDSLSETINGRTFEETMNRLVTGTALHAARRSVELGGTIAMLDSVNIDSSMSKAAKEKIEKLASLNLKDKFNGEKPEHWLQVIEAF
ncbi:prephenate dehydrogenase/arogenate dehydrogenase family protein [Domibacillus sp. DTU_2020_1001157_1_SI_ALB_TIR_016]|uniref:prephenate dehydrogenase/arogenate dehydrogenase family protein n=1 Tax=Domibacillus sp. DTU_2020_1001157_1_SI_ALB_TIR_016 TaxID=3077789 RepID=UPI0028EBDE36|nr:prephenate dehydrogenase/arogenate dehydrogenase family protein [Domibacillus sp. DTU_2020_1001157_1_SI_ALB_TIR_016]WNS78625.1 prephenate dehydrogenase/arogenate dehydrogenase family protein [Domibacillus sp. DTU_2020_1001157_1_SI_ALB_TIR_016]